MLVGSGVADFRWQNWNTTEAEQPSTPRVPSNKKAPLMYTTNRPERCTQDPENRKSFLAIKAAPYPYELTHLPTRRTLSELRAPTHTHLYSFPCVTHIIY